MIVQNAVLYSRVSMEDQATEDHFSLDAQLNEMTAAVKQKGWNIVATFVDEGKAGSNNNRPGLQNALQVIKEGKADTLVVHELSRLARSVYGTLEIFEILGNSRAGFFSVKDPDFDFADPTKRLFLTILAAINEYYLVQLRMHTRKVKHERANQGLSNASNPPFGYQRGLDAKKPFSIDEDEAPIVREMFTMYSSGRHSHQELADYLNQSGYRMRPNSRRNATTFSKDTIRQILNNPFYTGKVVYESHPKGNMKIFDGLHAPIISEELFETCRNRSAVRYGASRSIQKQSRTYLLSALAVCEHCGLKLRCQSSRNSTYYRDMASERGLSCKHQGKGARTEQVDATIHQIIAHTQLPPDWLAEIEERLQDNDELSSMDRRRRALEAERQRLIQLNIRGDFDDDPELYRKERERIHRELANLPSEDQLQNLHAIATAAMDLPETWAGAEPADQQDILRMLLEEVKVNPSEARVLAIRPRPLFRFIFEEYCSILEPVGDGWLRLAPAPVTQ